MSQGTLLGEQTVSRSLTRDSRFVEATRSTVKSFRLMTLQGVNMCGNSQLPQREQVLLLRQRIGTGHPRARVSQLQAHARARQGLAGVLTLSALLPDGAHQGSRLTHCLHGTHYIDDCRTLLSGLASHPAVARILRNSPPKRLPHSLHGTHRKHDCRTCFTGLTERATVVHSLRDSRLARLSHPTNGTHTVHDCRAVSSGPTYAPNCRTIFSELITRATVAQ